MALIPPFFLDCVVAISFQKDGGVKYGATGFLFGWLIQDSPIQKDKRYRVYLITNRHVFEGHKKAYLRFNPKANAPAMVFDLVLEDSQGNKLWKTHSDVEVDVAVQSINVGLLEESGIQFVFFLSDSHVLNRKKATEAGLTEGDGIFILGFPMGEVGKERNYVIVRQGCIARIRDALAGSSKDYLVDALIFPGNSGGPVINYPEAVTIQNTKSINAAYLIGVVSGYVPYQDIAISSQTNRPRIIFEENSGLAAVVIIDYAIEVIEAAEKMIQTMPTPGTPATDSTA